MKKVLVFMLVCVMALSLVACGRRETLVVIEDDPVGTTVGADDDLDAGVDDNLDHPMEGLADRYFEIFESGTYRMDMTMNMMGMEINTEVYVQDEMVASVVDVGGITARSVFRDGRMYVIDSVNRTVIVSDEIPDYSEMGAVETDGYRETGSGTADFNGESLSFIEYTHDETGASMQFFLTDDGALAGIRVMVEGISIDMIINSLDQNIPADVFEIPSDYEQMDLNSIINNTDLDSLINNTDLNSLSPNSL